MLDWVMVSVAELRVAGADPPVRGPPPGPNTPLPGSAHAMCCPRGIGNGGTGIVRNSSSTLLLRRYTAQHDSYIGQIRIWDTRSCYGQHTPCIEGGPVCRSERGRSG